MVDSDPITKLPLFPAVIVVELFVTVAVTFVGFAAKLTVTEGGAVFPSVTQVLVRSPLSQTVQSTVLPFFNRKVDSLPLFTTS